MVLRCFLCPRESERPDTQEEDGGRKDRVASTVVLAIDGLHVQPPAPPPGPPPAPIPTCQESHKQRDTASMASSTRRTAGSSRPPSRRSLEVLRSVLKRPTSSGNSDGHETSTTPQHSEGDSGLGLDVTNRSSLDDDSGESMDTLTWATAPRVVAALEEIVKTEGDYVLVLRTIVEGYQPRLAPHLDEAELRTVFGNSPSLCYAHAYLLEQLQAALGSSHGSPSGCRSSAYGSSTCRSSACRPSAPSTPVEGRDRPPLRHSIAQTAAAFQTMLPFLKLYATCA